MAPIDDYMIEQVSPTALHPTLSDSVLPRTTKGGSHGLTSHPCYRQRCPNSNRNVLKRPARSAQHVVSDLQCDV